MDFRDLKSNDEKQVLLEAGARELGYVYKRKRDNSAAANSIPGDVTHKNFSELLSDFEENRDQYFAHGEKLLKEMLKNYLGESGLYGLDGRTIADTFRRYDFIGRYIDNRERTGSVIAVNRRNKRLNIQLDFLNSVRVIGLTYEEVKTAGS